MALDSKTLSLLKEAVGDAVADALITNMEISKNAYEAVRQNLRPGITEIELKKCMDSAFMREDGTMIEYQCCFGAGKRTSLNEAIKPTDYVLKKGDAVLVDLWFENKGFWMDTGRGMFLGEPNDEAKRAYETVRKALRTAEQNVKAGMIGSEIFDLVNSVIENAGYNKMPHHVGHRVGATYSLVPPDFTHDGTDAADNGMILCFEPGVYTEEMGVRLEDVYLLTPDGLVDIFDYPMDLEYFCIDC